MGIGTAKEGGGTVIETIGLRRDSEDSEETEFEADDQGDDLEEDQGTDDLGSSENSPSKERRSRSTRSKPLMSLRLPSSKRRMRRMSLKR